VLLAVVGQSQGRFVGERDKPIRFRRWLTGGIEAAEARREALDLCGAEVVAGGDVKEQGQASRTPQPQPARRVLGSGEASANAVVEHRGELGVGKKPK
jgi:hypothetical protein